MYDSDKILENVLVFIFSMDAVHLSTNIEYNLDLECVRTQESDSLLVTSALRVKNMGLEFRMI